VNSLEMELQEALQSLDKLKKEKDMTLMKDHCLTVLPTVDQQTDRESCDLYGGSEAEREEEEIAECTSADEGVPLIPTLERLGKSKHTKDKVSVHTTTKPFSNMVVYLSLHCNSLLLATLPHTNRPTMSLVWCCMTAGFTTE
jgi:hypothetical protein